MFLRSLKQNRLFDHFAVGVCVRVCVTDYGHDYDRKERYWQGARTTREKTAAAYQPRTSLTNFFAFGSAYLNLLQKYWTNNLDYNNNMD